MADDEPDRRQDLAVHNCGFDLARLMHRLATAPDIIWFPHNWTLGPALAKPPTDEELLRALERAHALADTSPDRNSTYLARLAIIVEFVLHLDHLWDEPTRYAAALALIHTGAEAHHFTFRYTWSNGKKLVTASGYAICVPDEHIFWYHNNAERIAKLLEGAYEPPHQENN